MTLIYTLHVAGRIATRSAGSWDANLLTPRKATTGHRWEWAPRVYFGVPARDAWVEIDGGVNHAAMGVVLARAGSAVHRHLAPACVTVPLHLLSLSERDADTIGVEWHSWMMDTLEPVMDEKKDAERASFRLDVGNWKARR